MKSWRHTDTRAPSNSDETPSWSLCNVSASLGLVSATVRAVDKIPEGQLQAGDRVAVTEKKPLIRRERVYWNLLYCLFIVRSASTSRTTAHAKVKLHVPLCSRRTQWYEQKCSILLLLPWRYQGSLQPRASIVLIRGAASIVALALLSRMY